MNKKEKLWISNCFNYYKNNCKTFFREEKLDESEIAEIENDIDNIHKAIQKVRYVSILAGVTEEQMASFIMKTILIPYHEKMFVISSEVRKNFIKHLKKMN